MGSVELGAIPLASLAVRAGLIGCKMAIAAVRCSDDQFPFGDAAAGFHAEALMTGPGTEYLLLLLHRLRSLHAVS